MRSSYKRSELSSAPTKRKQKRVAARAGTRGFRAPEVCREGN